MSQVECVGVTAQSTEYFDMIPIFGVTAKFSITIGDFGFISSSFDSSFFVHKTNSDITLLLLYVDDMIITGNDLAGLEILSDSDGYYLSQAKYSSDILTRTGLTDCKTAPTPLETSVKLTPLDGTFFRNATLYRQLVGSLFLSAPRFTHYAVVLRILRYIKGTMFHGFHFSSHSSLELRAYSNADWASDPIDRRSTTGYCFFLGNSLIFWRSKKHSIIYRSSIEAKYCALADSTQELIWLRWLLTDMGISHSTGIVLCCDNQSIIYIAYNDVFHKHTKHIEIVILCITMLLGALYIFILQLPLIRQLTSLSKHIREADFGN
ncbi:uncharacterized mitochondrial protein AtMg00810-like [Cornus florida]|uniref:uncharacterized mitochondrial protein AtMg00810-like n=1 Tax=Cornus florida TaxID=4283 RepID=UPI00289D5FA4|nr:uncharacterized mitochondrial protein AtMg00810-like [Cornus florida]